MNKKLSTCLIVKNEEQFIEKCLESIKDISDEIIILDTGSTDKTVDIAKRYGKVFHTQWRNDFSKARNESLSYASNDWIFVIDGDEILDETTQKALPDFINNLDKNSPNVFSFEIVNPSPYKTNIEVFYRDALFRRNRNIKFVRPIHTYLDGKKIIRQETDFKIINYKNYRNDSDKKIKLINYFNMLNTAIKDSKDNNEKAHYIKHLIWDLDEAEEYEKALDACYDLYSLYNVMNYSKITNDYFQLLYKIIVYEYDKNNYSQCLKFVEEGLYIFKNRIELISYKGLCLKNLGQIQAAQDILFFSMMELIKYPDLKKLFSLVDKELYR